MTRAEAVQYLLYRQRSKAGICTACGQQPPAPDGLTCTECRQKNRDCRTNWRERKREAGLCIHCGQDTAMPGRVGCEACLLAAALKSQERPDEHPTEVALTRGSQRWARVAGWEDELKQYA